MIVEVGDQHATFTVRRHVIRRTDIRKLRENCTVDVYFTHLHTQYWGLLQWTLRPISQTFWHRLPIFQVDLHRVLHRAATSSCRGHVDELATEPFLLLHREHWTGHRRSWNCCDRRTCLVVLWKHFCFILYGHQDTYWLYDAPSIC